MHRVGAANRAVADGARYTHIIMQPSLRNAIARIDVVQQGQIVSRGTGFLVADGLVLTALHVVADRNEPSLSPYPGEIPLYSRAGYGTRSRLLLSQRPLSLLQPGCGRTTVAPVLEEPTNRDCP